MSMPAVLTALEREIKLWNIRSLVRVLAHFYLPKIEQKTRSVASNGSYPSRTGASFSVPYYEVWIPHAPEPSSFDAGLPGCVLNRVEWTV
jgi:hypothetical protein